jgi:hypothetical protein
MRAAAVISACALILSPALALADPTGTYKVAGHAADGSSTYQGTVEVTRTGPTYKVVWVIDGKQSVGTGLGIHIDGNTVTTSAATDKDVGLSVGYINKDSFGIGSYARKPDGTWTGVWTSGGSQKIVTETWTRQ